LEYQKGFADGVTSGVARAALAIRQGRPYEVTMTCPLCHKPITVDRIMLALLGQLADGRSHARELWEYYAAGIHSHEIERATA
jgi:hypothetical protein